MIDRKSLEVGMPFGVGGLVSPYMAEGKPFAELGVHDQARVIGWLSGCPVVEELTDPNNPAPGRGPEAMAGRYGEINEAFFEIFQATYRANSELAVMLTAPVRRKDDEPVGKHEEISIPLDFDKVMAPMATLAGYALPRLFIKEVKSGSAEKTIFSDSITEREARHSSALRLIDVAARRSSTPNTLVATFSELLAIHGHISVLEILKSVLPVGWYEEHQADKMLKDAKRQLELYAPHLWSAYRKMTAEDKQKIAII